ncbi:hypothetical protein ACFL2V_04510 [Pseudomonadota bacterium]
MAKVTAKTEPFTIEDFTILFGKSAIKEYLLQAEMKQIDKAVQQGNTDLLQDLYQILLKEKANDGNLAKEIAVVQDKLIDEFLVETQDIKKKYVDNPRKQEAKQTRQSEVEHAEEILKYL